MYKIGTLGPADLGVYSPERPRLGSALANFLEPLAHASSAPLGAHLSGQALGALVGCL